jgi:hypothetical protein
VNKQNTCETDPISLYFDKMRKKILSKMGAPYFQASGKIFQVAGVELSDPFFNAHGGHLQYVANKKTEVSTLASTCTLCLVFIFNTLPTKKTDVSCRSHL